MGKHKCFLALVASRAAPTASRRNSGKKIRSSYEVRDSFKESGDGVGSAAGLQRVRSHESQFDVAESNGVNGAKLKAGDYKLQWDGTGPNVEVSIMQGKTVVAKVPAKVVDLSSPAQNNAAVVKHNNDGTSTLAGARFEGKKFALELGDSGDGMQAGSSK